MDNNEFQKLVLEQLKSLDTRLTKLDSKFDVMEVRQNEIYEIVKAIEHSNQVGKAELDRHEFKISKIEGKLKKTGKVLADDTDCSSGINGSTAVVRTLMLKQRRHQHLEQRVLCLFILP